MPQSHDGDEAVEDKKGDDVELDFGKIAGFFKKKKNSEENKEKDSVVITATDESSNIGKSDEIDVGKAIAGIKGAFKSLKSGKISGGGGEESVDLSSSIKFLSKHYVILLVILGIIVSVGLGFNLRMQSGDLGFTDNWARNSIQSTINADISNFIVQRYPNLPESNRNQLAAEELSRAWQTGTYTFKTGQFAGQSINMQQQVEITSRQFKTFFQDETGRNYMPDIDPYYWWRYTQNILESGQMGDEVRDGIQWDNHQFAPVGRGIAYQDMFYPETIVFFYKIARVFKPGVELQRALMFYPVFLSALSTILVFLIARKMAGNTAAFFSATMVGVHASLINRTQFGHADSDAIAVFFSVLVLWLFIEAFSARKISWKIAFAAISGFATALYSLTWGGWWWIFDFVLAASAGTLGLFLLYQIFVLQEGNDLVRKTVLSIKDSVSRRAITTITAYFAATGIFITMFSRFNEFITPPLASLGFRTIKTPVVSNAAPNVLRTVAELNEGTVQQAINQIGSSLFYIAAFGIILLIARAAFEAYKKERNTDKIVKDVFYAAVLTIWFAATLYAVTKGIRFVLLLVPAFSIAFGVSLGLITGLIGGWVSREFKANKLIVMAVTFLMLFMVFPGLTFNSNAVQAARNVVNNDIPLINDAWFNSLKSIKDNSGEDAIITSWWDFGHHFKALADRAVTFDGTTQLSVQAHWVGRFFSTNNEQEAIGILRMLNCGANTGPEKLSEIKKDDVEGIRIAKSILMLGKEEARDVLMSEGLSEQQTKEVLDLTHCTPPESFVIASEDMIGKSGVWGHFGAWNFTKADIWRETGRKSKGEAINYMKERYEIGEEEANNIYREMTQLSDDSATDAWIGPWNGFAGGVTGCGADKGMALCGDGLIVNLTDYNAWYPTPQGNLHPISISYPTEDGKILTKNFENNTIPQYLSVLLVPSGESYTRVLGSPELIDGMFARMFYLKGHSLEYFKPLTVQSGFTGTQVWVWEVDWEGKQKNVIDELRPVEVKTEVESGDEVVLNYIGYFEDGTVFDSSIKDFISKGITRETKLDGSQDYNPLMLMTGIGGVIPGFEKGVIGAKLNEEKTIVVEPGEGYTEPSHPLFGKTLYFKINVAEIR